MQQVYITNIASMLNALVLKYVCNNSSNLRIVVKILYIDNSVLVTVDKYILLFSGFHNEVDRL